MPVNKEPDGRHSVHVEIEVPGTPDEVWQAIATGPGITSWFVPTDVDGRVGGSVTSHFGPGTSMDSLATVTTWEPPQRFIAESQDMGPEAPTIATEWSVQAQAGGTCIVRVVHSWFASTDDWDNQFEQAEFGWAVFFQILRLVLTRFRGQPGSAFQVMGATSGPLSDAWAALTAPLGLAGAAEGQQVRAPDSAPALAGIVELAGPTDHPSLLLRMSSPAPGLAHLFALPMGGQVILPIRLFLFGED